MKEKLKEIEGIPQNYHWIKFGRDSLFWWWPFITTLVQGGYIQKERRWLCISLFSITCEIRYR